MTHDTWHMTHDTPHTLCLQTPPAVWTWPAPPPSWPGTWPPSPACLTMWAATAHSGERPEIVFCAASKSHKSEQNETWTLANWDIKSATRSLLMDYWNYLTNFNTFYFSGGLLVTQSFMTTQILRRLETNTRVPSGNKLFTLLRISLIYFLLGITNKYFYLMWPDWILWNPDHFPNFSFLLYPQPAPEDQWLCLCFCLLLIINQKVLHWYRI